MLSFKFKKPSTFQVITYSCVAVISAVFFFLVLFDKGIESDLRQHVRIVQKLLAEESFPVPPLYYFSIWAVAGFSAKSILLYPAAILVLTFSVLFKQAITEKILLEFNASVSKQIIGWLTIALIFTMPFTISERIYLGKITPNVWHNSTTIFLMPFAIMLWYYSYKFLERADKKLFIPISFLIIINLLAKPSYLFVFFVAFPIASFIRYRFNKIFFYSVIPIAIGLTLLYLENKMIFHSQQFNVGNADLGFEIAPFKVWKHYSKIIPLDLLLSFIFPISVIVLCWKNIRSDRLFWYTISQLFIALLILALFSETGRRWYHGNFFWQAYVVSYLVYLYSLIKYLQFGWPAKNSRRTIPLVLIIMHVGFGITYMVKMIVTGKFH
jgi:hypothetical protein